MRTEIGVRTRRLTLRLGRAAASLGRQAKELPLPLLGHEDDPEIRPGPRRSVRDRPSTDWREGSARRRGARRPPAPPLRRRDTARATTPDAAGGRGVRRPRSVRGARRYRARRGISRRIRRDRGSPRSRSARCRVGRTRRRRRAAQCAGLRASALPADPRRAKRMKPITDSDLYARGVATLLASWEEYARGSSGAALLRLSGVAAAVFPDEPERAVYN